MSFENNFEQFLKASGYDRENMSKKEILDLQEAINNSKDSATIERHQREFSRQGDEMDKLYKEDDTNSNTDSSSDKPVKEKPFTPKQWSKRQKSPINLAELEKELLNHKDYEITFEDMLECSKESLEIIHHNPVYNLPIPTNPKYKKCTLEERAKLLCNYHTKISEIKTKLAKKSLQWAPYSKPILPSNKCKTSLLKNAAQDEDQDIDDPLDEIPTHDFYVSRAGRQIKRKIYTEDAEIDSDPDFRSIIKKNKAENPDTKITMDTPYIPEENHNNEDNITPKTTKLTKKETPKRSLSLSTKKLSRSELMFESLMHQDEKRKLQEEEMAKFEKTLPDTEEFDEDKLLMEDSPVRETAVEANEEKFQRKRIVPPLPIRKTLRSKKQLTQEDFDKIDIVSGSPPGSPILKQYTNTKSAKTSLRTQKSKENLLSESSADLEKIACPICDKPFSKKEIQNHAANCGIEEIEEFPEIVSASKPQKSQSITCELCDEVFVVSTHYEVHVKQCIASKVTHL